MYLEIPTFPTPKFSLTPKNFSPSVHSTNFLSSSRISFGFCNSSKRVSKSLTGLRNHGGLVGFRCRCEGGEAQGMGENDDGFYMRKGVELARKALGHTSPNPMVGCVIVKDGKVVGEGFHPKAGQPHAEVFALRDAGELAENATAYVTLEPCNHYGRTPPCSEALIKAKVKRVVVGMVDPNPIVASKGVEKLRNAGIDVTVGVEKEMCRQLNEAYIHQMLTGNPFVTLRYSTSVDGFLSDGLEKGATESGGYYSQLLQEYDAVIFSSSSLQKHSFPLSKEPGANQPLQIIISKSPTSPIQLPYIPSEIASKVIIFTDTEPDVIPGNAQQGVETVVLEKLRLTAILDYCKTRGICSVLVDIRENINDFKEILNEGFEKNLLRKFVVEALPVMGGIKEEEFTTRLRKLIKSLQLKNLSSRVPGGSILLEGYTRKKQV